jgi:hypothetical protein
LLTRRQLFKWLAGLPLLGLFPPVVREMTALSATPEENEGNSSIGEFFNGEELSYEIGFWLFKRAAVGRLSYGPGEKKGQYVSVLKAETLGVVGWISRYRVDTYRATMEEVDGGKRLRAVSFEEDVKIGDASRTWFHEFDYQKRKWTHTRRKKDGRESRSVEEIPPGMVYDDFLTASYNFRYGAYGAIERGRKYVVPTFPRKGRSNYEVRIAGEEEEKKRKKSEKSLEGKNLLIRLFLDPEVTHSKEGAIEGWLSKQFYPTEGTIRDVILFGDVQGRLTKIIRKQN